MTISGNLDSMVRVSCLVSNPYVAARPKFKMSGISFKFNKTVQQPNKVGLSKSAKSDEDETTDFVLSVDRNKILSTKPKEEEKELVIPLIVQNKWRLPDESKLRENLKVITKDGEPQTLEQQAANEIIAQTMEFHESRERSFKDENYEIPLILRNKIPEGYETDDKLDVSLRAEQSTLDDYDRIPVDKFGLAMLRGMGWKPGMAIGLRNKECVKPIEVVLRPKGLGLGADRSKALQNAKPDNDEDGNLLRLAIGSFVLIKEGNNKGLYGQVESIDDDTGRVYIKLAFSAKQIHLPELFIQVVSKKEYSQEGKVMNKSQYDEAVNERESAHRSHKKKRSKEKKKKSSRSRSPKHNRISRESKEYKNRHCEDEMLSTTSWLMPQIKVRLVDESYKKGKYYNIKVIIEDVLSPVLCICRTMDGKVLEDINSSMLETVIPRSEPSYIMVVRGTDKGMVGKIVHRDKSQCIATVQLFPDNMVSNFSYDDICEYVGDVSLHD